MKNGKLFSWNPWKHDIDPFNGYIKKKKYHPTNKESYTVITEFYSLRYLVGDRELKTEFNNWDLKGRGEGGGTFCETF